MRLFKYTCTMNLSSDVAESRYARLSLIRIHYLNFTTNLNARSSFVDITQLTISKLVTVHTDANSAEVIMYYA
jgi:hypothetical protein